MTTVSSNELCSWNLLWVGIKCSYYKKVTLFNVFLKILCFDVMINIFCTFVFQFFAASMLLLLLSRFRSVRLCATPETAAHQAPPSLGFSRQEHEWAAISFFSAWKWKVKVKSLSPIRLLATPWTAAYRAPPSMGFSRQEYWSGVPLPSPQHLRNSILPLS